MRPYETPALSSLGSFQAATHGNQGSLLDLGHGATGASGAGSDLGGEEDGGGGDLPIEF